MSRDAALPRHSIHHLFDRLDRLPREKLNVMRSKNVPRRGRCLRPGRGKIAHSNADEQSDNKKGDAHTESSTTLARSRRVCCLRSHSCQTVRSLAI